MTDIQDQPQDTPQDTPPPAPFVPSPGHAVSPKDENHPAPFGDGDALSFEVTKPVDLPSLIDEISNRVGTQVSAVFSFHDNDSQIVDRQHPAILFVTPASVSVDEVSSVIAAHSPVVEQPKAASSLGQAFQEALTGVDGGQDILDRLRSGETLKTAEITTALRALLAP